MQSESSPSANPSGAKNGTLKRPSEIDNVKEHIGEHQRNKTITTKRRLLKVSTHTTPAGTIVKKKWAIEEDVEVLLPPIYEWSGCLEFHDQDELVSSVFSYLEVSEVVRSQRVSKKWKSLCASAIEENFQPRQEFKTGSELRKCVERYYGSKYLQHDNLQPLRYRPLRQRKEAIDSIGRTFGYPIGKWQVGKVEIFHYVFAQYTHFNEDIGSWDLSSAINTEGMFVNAQAFNQDLCKWNTAKVTNMTGMFYIARAFNHSIAGWNVSKVQRYRGMFWECHAYNHPLPSGLQQAEARGDYYD